MAGCHFGGEEQTECLELQQEQRPLKFQGWKIDG